MTTRIEPNGPRPEIRLAATAARTTAQPARPFQQIISASRSAIVATAEQAATRLPGGPILAAALRPVPGSLEMGADPATAPVGATSALSGAASAGSATGPSMEGVLTQNADQNLYYLQLQERISQESRTFTALSNVLKARHETVKNAITNIR